MLHNESILVLKTALLGCSVVLSCLAAEVESQPISFRSDVAAILLENCLACHGPKKAEGGYRVDSFDELLKPGDTGQLPIVTSSPGGELIRRVTSGDVSERMPADADPLTTPEVEILKRWLAEGAKFDGEKSDAALSLVMPPKVFQDPPVHYPVPTPITAMTFSPDGSMLLVGGYHEITVWNTSDGLLARRIKNIGQRVFAIVFLRDEKTVAVGCGEPGRNGEVRLMDFESGQLKGVVARSNDVVLDMALRPFREPAVDTDSESRPAAFNELAIASADGLIRIVNTDTLVELRVIASHSDWVTAVAWSDDGTRLASASRDKTAKVFVADSGELLASYPGHRAAVRGVAFLPDGKQVYSTGTDKMLHRWEVEGAKKISKLDIGAEAYKIVRGENFVLVPGADHQLRRIDQGSDQVTQSLAGFQDWVLASSFHAGSHRIAGGAMNGEIRLWNAMDNSLIQTWTAKP